MPYVRRKAIVEVLVWEPFERPELPEWPGFPERPGRPEVAPPWVPEVPGIGGGPVLPGRPSLPPDFEFPGLPELPERPRPPVYPVVEPDDVGGHPEAEDLDLNATRKIAVSDEGNVFPAYVIVSGDSDEPRNPERGFPGTWVTVAYHGAIAWAWSPSVTMPTPPAGGIGRPPQRPGGTPGATPK